MDVTALNLRHLAALAATVRLGSLSAAAQAVNLSQPALTQGLAKLERQIGQMLFERRPDGMAATPAAVILAKRIDAAVVHIGSSRVTMAQMRAFIAVGDAGSYAGASDVGGLAQPSLHRAISDLSVALKRNLIERRGKGIALTDAGRRTLRSFRLARAEIAAGLSELSALAGRETGRISIGAMPLSRARLLPAAVTAFHRVHPDIDIRIVEGSHAELIEPLRDGEIDLLIGALRDPLPGSDVAQHALFADHPVVLGRMDHPLTQNTARAEPVEAPSLSFDQASAKDSPSQGSWRTVMVATLATYPWIVSAPGTPLRAEWERMFESAGVAPPHVPIECGSVITIRQILRDSDFLTLLSPDQVALELEGGWLAKICDAPETLVRTIGITTRNEWTPTPLQTRFLETLSALAMS
jgi:LysR family transcriptional regulator, regulator for genes of the gallate degradation pathway